MKVIIESPYKGSATENIKYARQCLHDSLYRGESPFASHLLYTQVLDDEVSEQRRMGMESALAWYDVADLCAVYVDLGISEGMEKGLAYARSIHLPTQERRLKNAS